MPRFGPDVIYSDLKPTPAPCLHIAYAVSRFYWILILLFIKFTIIFSHMRIDWIHKIEHSFYLTGTSTYYMLST